MLARTLYSEEHEMFRESVRRFFDKELAPHHEEWQKNRLVPRDFWLKAGAQGILCPQAPAEYGGPGGDYRYLPIVNEEFARCGASGPNFGVHSDITAQYILNHGSEEQKKTWLPKMVSGEVIAGIAMTEPGAGSDLQGVRTTAVRDGDSYIINGSKIFITNGISADLILVVAKTDAKAGAKGTSLILVEANREGFRKGRNLEKMGLKAQDTAELFFDDVRVPAANLLGGEENLGFIQMMQELPQERLSIATWAMGSAQLAFDLTNTYVKERKAFGKAIAEFQNTRFTLADLKTQIEAGWAFHDKCVALHCEHKLDAAGAAMVKLWTTEMQGRVVDACLQLFGGYGYMMEYKIAQLYVDARVQRIYGGTSEIMKELISRSL